METVIDILIVLCTIVVMESLSWAMHKFLFHGPLWFIHKTHHRAKHSFFEWNDVFSVFFAALSLYLMFIDRTALGYKFFIGVGISVYGIIYFVVHDWFVHQRFKAFKSKNSYLTKVRKAHKIHHKSMEKEHGIAFGLLYASSAVFKRQEKPV
ncbi:beta-carotene 3-hydroxylase [Pedobacter sp. UYP30]|uniref:sterol desaturase family protein n=1 Tax=Pedobacter sp. UYP30 TaxID=1756400 RepID=UPI00339AEAF2